MAEDANREGKYVLVEVPTESLAKIVVSGRNMSDHVPDNYFAALSSVLVSPSNEDSSQTLLVDTMEQEREMEVADLVVHSLDEVTAPIVDFMRTRAASFGCLVNMASQESFSFMNGTFSSGDSECNRTDVMVAAKDKQHAPTISSHVNSGGVDALRTLQNSSSKLKMKRVNSCIEVPSARFHDLK